MKMNTEKKGAAFSARSKNATKQKWRETVRLAAGTLGARIIHSNNNEVLFGRMDVRSVGRLVGRMPDDTERNEMSKERANVVVLLRSNIFHSFRTCSCVFISFFPRWLYFSLRHVI